MVQVMTFIGGIMMVSGGFLLACFLMSLMGVVAWMLGEKVYRRVGRTYDLYVMEYWIKIATENGRKIPTRKDVEKWLRDQEAEE